MLHEYDEELHDLNPSSAKPKRIKAVDNVIRMGEKRNAYRIFMVKPEGKKPLVEPSRSR